MKSLTEVAVYGSHRSMKNAACASLRFTTCMDKYSAHVMISRACLKQAWPWGNRSIGIAFEFHATMAADETKRRPHNALNSRESLQLENPDHGEEPSPYPVGLTRDSAAPRKFEREVRPIQRGPRAGSNTLRAALAPRGLLATSPARDTGTSHASSKARKNCCLPFRHQ